MSLSNNAERALIWTYCLGRACDIPGKNWFPDFAGPDPVSAPIKTFARLAGITEAEAFAAYAELEDAQLIERRDR